ncbi:MAG: hypothetical protein HN337_00740 [Deltaproteobacteria bacterium]|nr:hypothetical protein [Deltaproteobacteria bacterium]
MKRFMKVSMLIILLAVISTPAFAGSENLQMDQDEKISLSTKVPISLYGFVSAEGMFGDSQLSSFGALNNTPASYNRIMSGFNRVVDESVDGNNDAFISGTVQNTRFGFNLAPYDFGGKNFTVDARLEMDFFSTNNLSIHSVLPRIRRAYAGIGQERWHILFGQEWDLFSPLNTATLNIGGNLWQQGNLGFRRPQIRFSYNHPVWEDSKVEADASINLPGNSMAFNDNGNTTGIPMFQGRVGFIHPIWAGPFKVYLSALYARHKNAVAGQATVNNWGLALSVDAPIHKYFKPSLELHYGYSLGSTLSLASDTNRQRTISGWGQIKSLWLGWLESNIGYGLDTLKGSQVAAGWVKRNQMGFANIRFKPISSFTIGLEYNFLRTNYQGSGSSNANTGLLNVIYFF